MLDHSTIRLEHAVLQAFSTVMTLANWRPNRSLRAMHWFVLYNLVLLAGTILGFFSGWFPPLYSVVLSNLLFTTGYFLLFVSITCLFECGKRHFPLQVGLLLLGVVTLLWYGFFAPDVEKRIVAFSVVIGLQQMHSAFLLHSRRRSFDDSGLPLAGLLLCLATANAVRIVVALSPQGTALAVSAEPIYSAIEMLNTGLQCGTIVAYVWITASMLRRNLEVQATTDPLTGLLNRRAFERFSLQHLQQWSQLEGGAAVLTLDLDGFKQVNDTLGHVCGDEVLIRVAHCLRASLGPHDLAARLGGDEFALFWYQTASHRADALALDLVHAIAMVALPGCEQLAGISASIGLSHLQTPLSDWESVLTGCDNALYAAKRAGGNQVVTSSAALSALAETRNEKLRPLHL